MSELSNLNMLAWEVNVIATVKNGSKKMRFIFKRFMSKEFKLFLFCANRHELVHAGKRWIRS